MMDTLYAAKVGRFVFYMPVGGYTSGKTSGYNYFIDREIQIYNILYTKII